MKITRVRAYAIDLPMRIPYTTALVDRTTSNSVLTVVETDEGLTGLGQATTSAPLYALFEQYQEAIVAAIEQKLAPAVLGADPFDLEGLHDRMQRVARGHLYAHATIDLACHDLIGQVTGRPVYKLIGGAVRDRIPLVAPHLGLMPAAKLAEQAAAFLQQGYRAINLRAGADRRQDIANARAVRAAIGEEIPIALDFSQSLHFAGHRADTAITHLRALEPFGIAAFEQPLADWDIEGMARVAAAIDSPLVADESVRTPEDALRVIERRAADIIKIKLMKVGGIFPARKIAALCQAAAVPMTVGNGIAGLVLNAAEAHFAFSLPNFRAPGEMTGFLRLVDDVAAGDLTAQDGELLRPEAPGLGVRLDAARLERYLAAPLAAAGR